MNFSSFQTAYDGATTFENSQLIMTMPNDMDFVVISLMDSGELYVPLTLDSGDAVALFLYFAPAAE